VEEFFDVLALECVCEEGGPDGLQFNTGVVDEGYDFVGPVDVENARMGTGSVRK
jgi:hypothetical protein